MNWLEILGLAFLVMGIVKVIFLLIEFAQACKLKKFMEGIQKLEREKKDKELRLFRIKLERRVDKKTVDYIMTQYPGALEEVLDQFELDIGRI